MQCSSCMFFFLLALSWPLYLAFSFWIVISWGSELHVVRNEYSVGNSLPTRWARLELDRLVGLFPAKLASRTVSVLCPRSVVRVPSIALSLPTKHADWFLYFYIKRPFHRLRWDTHPVSDLFYLLPDPPFPSSYPCSFSPIFSFHSLLFYGTDWHETARCGNMRLYV